MTVSERIRVVVDTLIKLQQPQRQAVRTTMEALTLDELGRIANELEGCILIKPYSTELAHGKVKYLWVRNAGASATTWDEAAQRLQEWYDEEARKAEGGAYYIRGGCSQGRG